MIVFQLTCSNSHEFEAWFRSSESFESQEAAGDVECPHCGDAHVMKAPMAPNVVTSRQKNAVREPVETQISDQANDQPNNQPSDQTAEVRAREVAEQILRAVGNLRQQIEDTTDDVGDKFVDEARRIHYGETEEHGIRGVATEQEATELDEEGIDVFRLPMGPCKNS